MSDRSPDRTAASHRHDPLFARLCIPSSIREALDDPASASPILVRALADALDQAHRDYGRLLKECNLVYGELGKALGSHVPKAWDRIEEAMRRV